METPMTIPTEPKPTSPAMTEGELAQLSDALTTKIENLFEDVDAVTHELMSVMVYEALEDAVRSLSSARAALGREEVARIIDPEAWKLVDRERINPTPTAKNKEPWNWLRYYEMGCKSSLTKADAILKALAAPAGEQG